MTVFGHIPGSIRTVLLHYNRFRAVFDQPDAAIGCVFLKVVCHQSYFLHTPATVFRTLFELAFMHEHIAQEPWHAISINFTDWLLAFYSRTNSSKRPYSTKCKYPKSRLIWFSFQNQNQAKVKKQTERRPTIAACKLITVALAVCVRGLSSAFQLRMKCQYNTAFVTNGRRAHKADFKQKKIDGVYDPTIFTFICQPMCDQSNVYTRAHTVTHTDTHACTNIDL